MPRITCIGADERRARLAVRHHLAPPARAAHVTTVARDLVALHATDPSTVYLAAWARLRSPAVQDVSRAIYDERELVRILGMRRTMFVLPVELMPVVQAACTRAIAVVERRRTVQFLEQSGIAEDPATWLAEVEDATVAALASRGEALSVELSADEPRLAEQIRLAEGKSYAAWQSVASRVLPLLAAHGRVVRGRPRGSWTSSQYRWSTVEAWLPAGVPELKAEEARVDLARAWLRTFGPAPVADLKWWSGWTLGQTRAALAELGPAEVDLDGVPGVALADDLAPTPAPEPYAVLLPALDPSVMGWQARGWFLGAHKESLFDTNGNAGPTVWWDGRVVGGWAQRRDGEIVLRLLEDVGTDATAAVTAEAARLQDWIGPVRVTPRFRTPLERRLSQP
ncbi:MAG: winged helix DNA-binding domain-containing protein [Mycobacteriales bacterium]